MAKYKGIVTTDAGLELLAKACSGGSVNFTAVKTGDGAYDGTEDLSGMTALKSEKQSFGVSGITRIGTQVRVRSVLSNEGLTTGYNITEIGLFAKDPETSSEFLYAIIVAETGLEDYLPPHEDSPSSITMEIYLMLTETENDVTFTAEIVPGTYASAEDFQDHVLSVGHITSTERELWNATAENLNSIQSTSKATLSTAGWYRVAEYRGNANSSQGGTTNSCEITIKRGTSSYGGTYRLYLESRYEKQEFKVKCVDISAHILTKIRYVIDTQTNIAYIEVYNTANSMWLVGISNGKDERYSWKAIDAVATSETVDGVTVTTTYDIPAKASPVTSLDVLYQRVPNGTDVNTLIKQGLYYCGGLATNFANAPSDTAHNGILEVYYASDNTNLRCVQRWTSCNENRTYERTMLDEERKPWKVIATTADLAKYLPLDGSVPLDRLLTIGKSDLAKYVALLLKNNKRSLEFGITENGTIQLYDTTNGKSVFASVLSGNNVFYGRSTENLPLTGGQVKGTFSVRSDTASAIWTDINNTLRRVYQTIYSDGGYALVDGTNGKNIILSMLDGIHNTFYGIATGNIPLDGSAVNINPVNDLNKFSTGIAIFSDSVANKPGDGWWLVIAGGQANSTASQIAFDLLQNKGPRQRRCASGTWYAWDDAKSNSLPLTGGTLTDNTFVKRTDSNSVMLGVENALNKLHSGVNGSGVAYMQDKNGNVIVCNTDGARTFYGHSSEDATYEEGTFDLTLEGRTLSGYKYTKIGNFVYLSGTVAFNGEPLTIENTTVEVHGLPFGIASGPYIYFGDAVYSPSNKATGNLVNYVPGGTYFGIGGSGSTSFAVGTPCVLHAMYITD